jgi:hypothetical protein
MADRPYLLLDVDGPLNPHRAKTIPPGYALHDLHEGEKTWTLLLSQQHGLELNALATSYELVWATSWEHGANRLIAPRLGLPDLPVITWPGDARSTPRRKPSSWKTRYVAEWVGARPFVWVDDEVNRFDRAHLLAIGGLGRHLVHRVDASRGLSAADFAVLRAWVE